MTEGRDPLVRRLRRLRRERALRDAEGVLVAEGVHLAEEALTSGATVLHAAVSPRLSRVVGGPELHERMIRAGFPITEMSDDLLATLQDARSPQPVVLIVQRPVPAVFPGKGSMWVVAYGLQDPGNLGTLARTSLAAGADGLVVVGPGVDPFHPRAVRATAGAVFRFPTHIAEDLVAVCAQLREAGLAIVAADPRRGLRYDAYDWNAPFAVLLGSEGAGLPAALDGWLDARVVIPLAAGVDSLSVSAAAAVLLFAASRARGFSPISGSPAG